MQPSVPIHVRQAGESTERTDARSAYSPLPAIRSIHEIERHGARVCMLLISRSTLNPTVASW
eukprot:4495866-Pleurochrysis_carterae.AAC.4